MPVITMNVRCGVSRRNGNDAYGRPKFTAFAPTKCAVLKLQVNEQHTTVRADASGSRGHADEVVADAVLLMPKTFKAALGDKIKLPTLLGDALLIITSIRHRFDVMGRPDHFEVGCAIE